MRLSSLIIILALLATSGFQADSQTQVGLTDCDCMAANPPDPGRVTAGVPRDHANAQVSYVDSALSGRFDTCESRASDVEMADFLDGTSPQLDYVGGLLIANLKAGLNNRLGK